jgi:hypothetical protein
MFSFLRDHIPSLSDFHNPEDIRFVFEFPNGYGASVIRNRFSYGNKQGLWELAVLNEHGNVSYDNSISRGVMGYLKEEEISDILYRIHDL